MNKEEYIENIFGEGKEKQYNCIISKGNKEHQERCICKCGNEYFYRLVSEYIVCSKCFTGYSCNIEYSYLKTI